MGKNQDIFYYCLFGNLCRSFSILMLPPRHFLPPIFSINTITVKTIFAKTTRSIMDIQSSQILVMRSEEALYNFSGNDTFLPLM